MDWLDHTRHPEDGDGDLRDDRQARGRGVRVTVAGRVRVSRLMQAGEREEFSTNGTVLLEVGNAAAFDYTINGSRGRALGAAGQVVRATIRQDNLDSFIAR